MARDAQDGTIREIKPRLGPLIKRDDMMGVQVISRATSQALGLDTPHLRTPLIPR
jgi:hypothetical protein